MVSFTEFQSEINQIQEAMDGCGDQAGVINLTYCGDVDAIASGGVGDIINGDGDVTGIGALAYFYTKVGKLC